MKKWTIISFAIALAIAALFFSFNRHKSELPLSVLECIRKPDEMILYSIDPIGLESESKSIRDSNSHFHGYYVVSQIHIKSSDSRKFVSDIIEDAISSWDGNYMLCFNPRHGLRVSNGEKTYDLLICFECQQIYSYVGEQELGLTGLTGSGSALDELLRSTKIPLSK